MKKIECVIFDWAGTVVDYGCFAPVAAFVESFEEIGLPVTPAETRAYMGLTKVEEIRALFRLERVSRAFRDQYGRDWNEDDVQARYQSFQKILFATLERYTEPILGVIEAVEKLRAEGIKIGSTTGYARQMMDLVIPAAEQKGYQVDYCATSDLLPAGRPAPYMIFENMTKLSVPSLDSVVKVGDTIADIREGVSAKVCSVGVILGSNEMALTQEETLALPAEELEARIEAVRQRMLDAGASYTIRTMQELPALIEKLNENA